MNCDEIRRHWHLYHDSEGDAELHWQVSEHLANCAACAEWFAKQSRFEDLLSEKLASGSADDELWHSVLSGAGLVRPASSRRWLLFSSLAACAAAMLLLVGGSLLFRESGGDRSSQSLSALTANWHDRLATGRQPLAFESQSDLEVEDYLRHEVTFPVRCPPRKDSGFAVHGAGTCRLAGEPAAFVVGQVDREAVSIFILSRNSLASFPLQMAALKIEAIHRCRERGYEMALSVVDRNLVLIIGRAPPDSLLRVLHAYGTYPHGPA